MSEYPPVRRPLPTLPPTSRARRLPPDPPSRRRCLLGARGPGSRRWRQLLPARAAQRRAAGSGPADAARGRQLDLGTEGRERTPWSRARTGHGRLAAVRAEARDVLATGTLEALGATASRSLTQAVRDGRGALANARAAHRASSNGGSRPVSAGKLNAPAEARNKREAGRAKPPPHLRDCRLPCRSRPLDDRDVHAPADCVARAR